MINYVDLDYALNNIIEVEILEVIVGRDVQFLEKLVLNLEISPEFLCPTEWSAQFQHEVWEVSDLHKASALYQKQKSFK
jgi:hypothetical protein